MIPINLSSLIANGGSPLYDPAFPTGNRPIAPTGTVFAQANWSNGVLLPTPLSVDSVWSSFAGGSSTLAVVNGAIRGTNINAVEGNDIVLGINGNVLTNHVYAEFDAKFTGTPHAIKFFKVHGKTTSGYANCTYGVDGGGEISRFSFGDGSTTTNDTANILLFDGTFPSLIGRSYGTATIATPQLSSFAGSLWNNAWHHFRIYHKFNSGTSAGNEIADGEMFLEIDGLVYGHITNMFNRHWSNDTIEYISFFDVAQGGGSYVLEYDNIFLSTGGWKP